MTHRVVIGSSSRTAWSGTMAVTRSPAWRAAGPPVVAVSLLGPVAGLVAAGALHERTGPGVWIAIAGILVGVPHGAADHLVPFWTRGGRTGRRSVLVLLVAYLLTLAIALAAVLVAARWALLVFLVVSAAHFGRGEAVFAAERSGRPTPGWRDDLLVTTAHGLVVVGFPLLVWPSVSLPLLDAVAPGFSATARAWTPPLAVLTAVAVTGALGWLVVRRRWSQVGELLSLVLLMGLVDPLAAFGVYFALWHSARHILRLIMLPGPVGGPAATAGTRDDLRRGAVRYLRAAAVPSGVAVALLVAIWMSRRSTLLSAELSLLVALTAPHLVVVGRLDAVLARQATRTTGRATG